MKISVNFADRYVHVDGEARKVILPKHDPNWTAIQYDSGHKFTGVEVKRGAAFSFQGDAKAMVEPYLKAWKAAAIPPSRAPTSGSPSRGAREM